MRTIICLVIAVALLGLTACSKAESPAPADPQAQEESEPITKEDFETGQPEEMSESGGDTEEEAPAETP